MNISLPETVKEFADSESIRDLIRDDGKRKTQEKLETLLPARIEGSGPTEMTRQDWDSIRAEVEKASLMDTVRKGEAAERDWVAENAALIAPSGTRQRTTTGLG